MGHQTDAAFPIAQWLRVRARHLFPNHSDEIVQDFHLFPFYPPSRADAG